MWLIKFHRNAFYAREINGNLFVYIADFTFEIRARAAYASRHWVNTRELPLKERPNFHQVGDPIEKHTDLFKHGYIIVVGNSPFPLEKGSVQQKFSFETHRMIKHRHRRADDTTRLSQRLRSIARIGFPQNPTRCFAKRGGGGCHTCLQDNVVTWQSDPDCSRFKL